MAAGNVCEICGRSPDFDPRRKIKELTIDHDHKTGKIRGLLCWQCNLDLEIYVKLSKTAPAYLKKASKRNLPRVRQYDIPDGAA